MLLLDVFRLLQCYEANHVWWHKLIRDWTKTDYAFFSSLIWILIFGLLVTVRFIEERSLDLLWATAFSLAMIPFELVVIFAFQKYSSNTEDLSLYPVLSPTHFEEDKLLKNEKSLVFFYTEWCPYCRKSFQLLKSLDKPDLKVFRVDLSDETNPLWVSLKISVVPTLIAFKEGAEFWRANGISMVGLRKKDFKQAIIATS